MSDSGSSFGFDMIQNMQKVNEKLFGNRNPAETALEQDHMPESDVNVQIPPAEMESGSVQPVDSLDPPDASFNFEKIGPENLGDKL